MEAKKCALRCRSVPFKVKGKMRSPQSLNAEVWAAHNAALPISTRHTRLGPAPGRDMLCMSHTNAGASSTPLKLDTTHRARPPQNLGPSPAQPYRTPPVLTAFNL